MSKRKMILQIVLGTMMLSVAGCSSQAPQTPQAPQAEKVDVDGASKSVMADNPLFANSSLGLLHAIERRNSAPRGEFTGIEISEDALHLLAWSATGKNRGGTGFTVPLAMRADPYVSLYLAQKSGVRKYSWQTNSFENVIDTDIIGRLLAMYEGGLNASAIWIYVIEKDSIPRGIMDFAWLAIGAMSQHQYLVAEEIGVQARYLASFGKDEAASLLGLDTEKQIPAGVLVMARKEAP